MGGTLFIDRPPAIDRTSPVEPPHPPHSAHSHSARVIKRVALACFATGVLLLAFVAYQLWGTALYEHHAQGVLRQELKARGIVPEKVHHAVSAPGKNVEPIAPSQSTVAPAISGPAIGQPIGLMSIPAIGMSDDAIVQGTGEAQLEQGPGHYSNTPLPGEAGNAAIAGHRTTYAAPFYELNTLQPGDLIYIVTSQGSFVYEVSHQEIVSPSNTTVLDASTTPELTLTTCNPRYSASQRLVVVADLESSVTAPAPSASPANPSTPVSRVSLPEASAVDATVSGPTTIGEVGEAILWGVLTAAFVLLSRLAWARMSGWPALALVVLSAPVVVAALLMCFQHVSLALPETF